MRKFLIFLFECLRFLIKATLALVLLAATTFAAFVGWNVGHYESRIDLPSQQQLETISASGGICGSHGGRDFIPLQRFRHSFEMHSSPSRNPTFFSGCP